MSDSKKLASPFKSLPFHKLQIEEEKEDTGIKFEYEEDEYLQQPAVMIIPLNVPVIDYSTNNK